MRVYFAASYGRRQEIKDLVSTLPKGIEVTSTWLNTAPEVADFGAGGAETPDKYAKRDLIDINDSQMLIVFAEPDGKYARGGKHAEFGYALAKGLRLGVVGQPEHVFQCLQSVEHWETWEDCVEWLSRRAF